MGVAYDRYYGGERRNVYRVLLEGGGKREGKKPLVR